ncbi:phage tail tape measure protein [Salibacterium qingdaonense]|uniref:Phage-related minor tail protein n=1 Tax=Salibacterium qingdaonense TaxID=266892 RepID=A0A1I4Q8A3_9BACI|nr:phage tail tape measure protein [Salibacterium qingdaonense]SFM35885.1 Phage-related minor tail protein [Salibacterium qingdaonense]
MALRDLAVGITWDIDDRALRRSNETTDDYIDNIKRGDRVIDDMGDTMQDSGDSMRRELQGVGRSAENLSAEINGIEDPNISGRQATGQLANVDSAADDASGGIRSIADPNISGRQATGQLQNVEGAANDASNEVRNMPNPDIDTKQSERKLDNLEEKASGVKETLGGIAGVLGGAQAAQGIDNFESLAAKLETRLGVSEEEAENLRSRIANIYSTGRGDSMEEVEQSVRLTRNVTGDSDADLQKQARDVLNISDAWGADVNEVIDAARANAQSMETDFSSSLDTIATGMQSGVNVSGDYLETIQEFSPAFNRIGADNSEMISILQSGMEAGVRDTDRMADSINEFGIRMQETDNESLLKVAESLTDTEKEAEKLADTWQSDFAKGGQEAKEVTNEVVNGLLDMEGEVGYMETATGLFGTMWEDTSGRVGEAISSAEGKTTDLKDSTSNLDDQYDTTGQKIRNFGRSISQAYDTLDQKTGGVLSSVTETIGGLMPVLGGFVMGKGGLEGLKNAGKKAGGAIKCIC